MPSICQYNVNITGTVTWVQRNLDSNTVQIGISLSPDLAEYPFMDYTDRVTTNMPCTTGSTYRYDQKHLVV